MHRGVHCPRDTRLCPWGHHGPEHTYPPQGNKRVLKLPPRGTLTRSIVVNWYSNQSHPEVLRGRGIHTHPHGLASFTPGHETAPT